MIETLSSWQNPLVQGIRRLAQRRERRRSGTFVVEGKRAIDGFIEAGFAPEKLLLRDDCELPTAWPQPHALLTTTLAARLSHTCQLGI